MNSIIILRAVMIKQIRWTVFSSSMWSACAQHETNVTQSVAWTRWKSTKLVQLPIKAGVMVIARYWKACEIDDAHPDCACYSTYCSNLERICQPRCDYRTPENCSGDSTELRNAIYNEPVCQSAGNYLFWWLWIFRSNEILLYPHWKYYDVFYQCETTDDILLGNCQEASE